MHDYLKIWQYLLAINLERYIVNAFTFESRRRHVAFCKCNDMSPIDQFITIPVLLDL